MKTHVVIGVDAINKIISRTESHAFLRHAYNIIRGHHEKWDGTGYPYGLKGEDIPLEGRLMAVADVYDALVSVRPYKKAFSHDEACKMIEADAGKYFDPALVDVFLNVKSKFKRTSSDNNLADRENVNLLTLTKDMEVGVPAIDAQHRELIDRMNNVIAVGAHPISKEKAQQALDFLGKYVIKHFSDEEDLQKQSRYPKHNVHKSQHQVLIGELRKLRLEFAANAISDTLMRKLNNSIIQWVLSHIKGSDVEFGKYYQLRDSISRGAEADKAAEEKSLNLNEIEGLDGAGSTAGPYTVQDRVP